MTVARKNKYFNDSKDSEAAETIAGTYSLETDIEDTSVKLEAIVQYNCTDWDFILSRMEANGKLCFVDDGKLTTKKPDFSASTVLDAVFGATMLEFDADLDARNQYQALKAKTWDYANQAITSVDAAEPGFEENGNIPSSDLGDVLKIAEFDVFSGEDVAEDELQNLADARLLKARMSRLRGRARFRGFAAIKPGDLINLGGVGERFNGKVFLTGIRQEIANGVWNTDVQFGLNNDAFTTQPEVHAPPAADMLPAIQGLQIGVVTDLESDPESQDRIRVRLPIIDEAEDGVWARIACLDAGDNRGTFFRPEIADEVIVGFLNNDPRKPVVLGMVNSSSKPAPVKAANDNHEKGYVSRSGMKMVFNDDEKSIKIETPAGKKVTISEKDGVMTLEDENNNKVTMDSSAISVESGKDIKLKATGDLTIEAVNIKLTPSANFTVSAGGSSIEAGSGSAKLSAPTVTG
jgi:Rhs element Vgr protein